MRVHCSLVGVFVAAVVSAAGCQGRLAYNLPPAERLMEPGPGVGGPGPGVIPPVEGMGMSGMDGAVVPAGYGFGGPGGGFDGCTDGGCYAGGPGSGINTSQVSFLGDEGIQISWDANCQGTFDSVPLVTPGRQDFSQGAIYRLKVTNVPGRPAVELYPTLEVAPVTPRTDAYLAHAPIPVQFTEEDFDQVLSGNFVTKVIYLPDPEFQELALAGVETLVSTRLDPGIDPIAEADRRGSILAIVRMGNKDLERHGPDGEYDMVVPAAYQARGAASMAMPIPTAAGGAPAPGAAAGVAPAQYCYDNGAMMEGMPMGMPTAGFAPPAVPPQMIAGGGQWGMPITGTPIGLPGPPHVPLGGPAGLQKHVMKNRTRTLIPPPTTKVRVSVKQRPGLNYPKPVNRVYVDETHREPVGLFSGVSAFFDGTMFKNLGAPLGGYGRDANCN